MRHAVIRILFALITSGAFVLALLPRYDAEAASWANPNPISTPPAVPGVLVITLRPGTNLGLFNARWGLQVVNSLPDGGTTYLVSLPGGAIGSFFLPLLASDPSVQTAEPDATVVAPESPMAEPATMPNFDSEGSPGPYISQYALNLINAPAAWNASTGRGTTVAVLDTGADLQHPMLQGHLTPGFNTLTPWLPPIDYPQHVDSNGNGTIDDAWGHGTHVAGIVALVAPQAKILPIKVLDSDGVGSAFSVAVGIYYAVDRGAQVINMSLGMAGPDTLIANAIAYAVAHNVLPVASAGNDGLLNAVQSPAIDPGVLAVTATDQNDQKASFSNYGNPVAVDAPGVNIYSLFHGNGYATWSGTSMAAPFVSGEAALLRSLHPDWSDTQVIAQIESSAVPIDSVNPGYAGELGSGRINVGAAVLNSSMANAQPSASTGSTATGDSPSVVSSATATTTATDQTVPVASATPTDQATTVPSSTPSDVQSATATDTPTDTATDPDTAIATDPEATATSTTGAD